KLIVTTLGGPAASLICGLVLLVGGEVIRSRTEATLPSLSVLQLAGAYSLLVGFLSFRSFRVGPLAGDGMLLRALISSRVGATQAVTGSALSVLRNKNPDGVNWNDRWLRVLGETQGLLTPYHAAWHQYAEASARNDMPTAARSLEHCLERSAW